MCGLAMNPSVYMRQGMSFHRVNQSDDNELATKRIPNGLVLLQATYGEDKTHWLTVTEDELARDFVAAR